VRPTWDNGGIGAGRVEGATEGLLNERDPMRPRVTLIAVVALCPWAAAGEAERWPFAGETTFAERVAASPRNKPLEADSLVLPHPHAVNILPGPSFAKAGAKAIPLGYRDLDAIVWEILPRNALHEQYLEKRKALLAEGQVAGLVDWCEHNHLAACAEFELRARLHQFKSFRDPGYRAALRRWLKHADLRQIPYTFPLPVKGTWYIARDSTGHHRVKAGAAYALDFLITKDGHPYQDNPRKLENYYAWDQPILAQADGVVTAVVDHKPDVEIGQIGGFPDANIVIVDYGGGILALYAHIRRGSAKVSPGDRVELGQELARVGNSGASGMPHLHLTFLDHAHFSIRGRFRCGVRRGPKWQLIDGEDLQEGDTVRSLKAR